MTILERMLCMAATLRRELGTDLPDDQRAFAAARLAELESAFQIEDMQAARQAVEGWRNAEDRAAVLAYVDGWKGSGHRIPGRL